jgi:amino acid adenylation domain-containing protein
MLEKERTVHAMVIAVAEAFPSSPAVVDGGTVITYQELIGRARHLAARLQAHGAGPDRTVAVCVDRHPGLPIAVLAVLMAGAAYVPLDPSWPEERLRFMLEDARAVALVTEERLPLRLGGSTVLIEGPLGHQAPAPLPVSEENLAYVIYTSGSTGRPKGVAMPHRALIDLLEWQATALPPGPRRVLNYTSLSFDVSFQEIFGTWIQGGALYLLSDDARRDPMRLWRFLSEARIQRLFLPYVALAQLAEAAAASEEGPLDLEDVVTAGEQLLVTPSVRALFERLSGCRLHNHYGPSETHVVTAHTLSARPAEWPVLPPIGLPLPNVTAHVLDLEGNPAATGELVLEGRCVARGYLGRPDLTAERFAAGRYRTGDLVHRGSDGVLEFLGRADHQVKIRGYRVEPGEIEACAMKHPGVSACVVVARDGSLVGYVIRRGDIADLAAFLSRELPDYMVPAHLVVLDRFPLTPSGKVDRRALPPPVARRPAWAAPESDTERTIAAIWEEVLGVARVGLRDSFFALGGKSLQLAQVQARIRERLGVELAVADLFATPTVADLAHRIDHGRALEDRLAAVRRRAARQRRALA